MTEGVAWEWKRGGEREWGSRPHWSEMQKLASKGVWREWKKEELRGDHMSINRAKGRGGGDVRSVKSLCGLGVKREHIACERGQRVGERTYALVGECEEVVRRGGLDVRVVKQLEEQLRRLGLLVRLRHRSVQPPPS